MKEAFEELAEFVVPMLLFEVIIKVIMSILANVTAV